ncbi:MAG TPA: TIM barrel protein [Vicinamibacterales bacterium]|nr:TIM barrel protein [Vicinamibacterales bacterium]
MHRRHFVKSTLMMGAALATTRLSASSGLASLTARPDELSGQAKRKFRLHYAPHFGMFTQHAGEDLVAQLEFMAAEGFTALEDNGMRERTPAVQEKIGSTLARLNMRMGVFVAHNINWEQPTLTSPDPAKREAFLKEIRESVEVAKRVNAKWMTVVPGHVDRRPHMDYQTANVVETLKRACAILEPHQLVMVLEPLNTLRNHPGMFLTTTPQAYLVCKAVASPSCKILYDIYHQQITEGNLIPNINAAWDEIAYLQVGDNPGRKEPGTGEINYSNVFKHVHGKGFTGVVGMEHGNFASGRDGERAVIDSYVKADAWS